MRRTKQDALQTRDAILDAAERVFFERGVARSSLEGVARRAGVTRGAVYWHFRNKPDLFMALNERLHLPHEVLAARLAANPDLDPLAEVEEAMASLWRAFDADDRHRRLLTILFQRCEYVGEMAPVVERQLRADRALQERLRAILEHADAHRPLAWPWRPENAARALFALIRGVILNWLRGDADASLSEEGLPVARALLASIRGAGC